MNNWKKVYKSAYTSWTRSELYTAMLSVLFSESDGDMAEMTACYSQAFNKLLDTLDEMDVQKQNK